MMLMTIDPTITTGNIISVVSTVGAIGIAAWKIIGRINRMDMKINLMWQWFKKEHNIEDKD
jgi:hypothetical protein